MRRTQRAATRTNDLRQCAYPYREHRAQEAPRSPSFPQAMRPPSITFGDGACESSLYLHILPIHLVDFLGPTVAFDVE
jgi:hypothetical protein